MKLETGKLGQSDLEITRIGIGTAPIGSTSDWRIYWGVQDEVRIRYARLIQLLTLE